MAKRRLNTKFVGMLAGSVLGAGALVGGGIYVKHRYFREKPDRYLAIGREAFAAHDYEKARENLLRAATLSPPDPALDVLIGDTLNALTYKDAEYVAGAQQMWEHAIGVDPSYIPALERLVKFWDDELDLGMRPSERTNAADRLSKAAQKLLDVDPRNPIGRRAAAQATIEIMLDGRPTPPSRLNQAEEDLLKLSVETPADADLPYWVARSRLRQANDAARSDDTSGAATSIRTAESVMLDGVKQQPNNALMAYHNGQVLLQIASIKEKMNAPADEVNTLVQRALSETERARSLSKPEDPEYIDINLYDARLVLDHPDTAAPNGPRRRTDSVPSIPENPLLTNDESTAARHMTPEQVITAERIYSDVLAHRPNEPFTRLAFSQLLGDLPGQREKAMELLSTPFVEDHPVSGIKGTLLPLLQSESDIRLLGLRLDALDTLRDKSSRDALIAQCQPLSDRILGRAPDSPAALGLRGRLELAEGRIVEATQSLRRALALIDSNNVALVRTRYELMFYLARAYELAQQTGEAKKLANDVAALYTSYIPARLMLARLYIAERDFEDAKKHIDYLATAVADSPQLANTVLRMRLAIVDAEKDPVQFKSLYDQLPESNRDEQFDKARIAHGGKLDDESLRLLSAICTRTPGDVPAVQLLASLYASRNQIDQAQRVVNAAFAINPRDLTVVSMKMHLDGKSQDEIDAEMQRLGASAPDQVAAFNQEMAQVDAARRDNDSAAVDRHIAAAQKIKAEDPRLWDAMFMRDLELAQWDKAQALLDKLASNDVDRAGGMLYRIRMATAQNDLNKSLDLAVKLTRDKPEFSQSWCILGDVQRAAGKYDDAMNSYQFALDRQVQNLDALRGLIQCSYAMNKSDIAYNYIAQARKIDPKNAEFKELELTHELTYGDPQKVIAPREDAVKATPNDVRAWLNLASAYMAAAQGRTVAKDPAGAAAFNASAEQTLRDGMAKFPDDERFPLTFSKVALAANDFAAGEQVMQAFAARPNLKGLPQVAIILSDFYNHAGKLDDAIRVLQEYLAKPITPPNIDSDVDAQLRLSSLLSRAGRIDDSLAALTANSDREPIARQRIALLINSGRLVEADKALAIQAAHGPLSADLQNLQGVAQLAAGRVGDARQTFDRLLVQQPDNVEALMHRAQMIIDSAMPNYRLAFTDLAHARDVAPANVEVRLSLARLDRQRGQMADAAKELEGGIRKAPNDKRLRLTLVDHYASQQQWDDANRVLHEASLLPDLAADPDLIHADAVIAMGRRNYPHAEELMLDAMSKAPTNMAMVWTYYDVLLAQRASGRLISHSDDLLASRNNDPSLWRVYEYRARARLIDSPEKSAAAGELQHALASAALTHDDSATTQIMRDYAKLIGVDAAQKVAADNAPQNSHWQLIAAGLSEQSDDAAGAVRWYEMALKHFDTLSSADQTLLLRRAAGAYQKLSPPDVARAADMYRRLIAINPNDVKTLNNLACLLAEPGVAFQPREALDYSERAYTAMTQSGDDEPLIKDTYGWTLIVNGRTDEGSNLVQEAISKMDFPEAHYHLAEAMLKRSPPNADDAATELLKAIRLLDQAEREGKPVDPSLKLRLEQELKRARGTVAG